MGFMDLFVTKDDNEKKIDELKKELKSAKALLAKHANEDNGLGSVLDALTNFDSTVNDLKSERDAIISEMKEMLEVNKDIASKNSAIHEKVNAKIPEEIIMGHRIVDIQDELSKASDKDKVRVKIPIMVDRDGDFVAFASGCGPKADSASSLIDDVAEVWDDQKGDPTFPVNIYWVKIWLPKNKGYTLKFGESDE